MKAIATTRRKLLAAMGVAPAVAPIAVKKALDMEHGWSWNRINRTILGAIGKGLGIT